MTKQVRIENADTSDHKVRVHVEEQHADGTWHRVRTVNCDFPTAMAAEVIYTGRRLVIEEEA